MTKYRRFAIPSLALLVAPVAALTLAATLTAATAPPPKAAIAARQTGYKKMGAAMKAINDQLKTDAPARAVMLAAAQTLAATARDQPKFFPAGSGPGAGVATDALPNIWSDRAAFDSQMARMIAETGKLVAAVNGGNTDAIRVQTKATGGTCSSCHRQFRADT